MADVEQVPSFRQAPTESGRIRVDVPGLSNTQVEFPPDASMEEIAQRVDEISSQYRSDITTDLPQTIKYLPESLSTGLGYLGGAMKRPLSIAASPAGQAAGQLTGRLTQDVTRGVMESMNPPQVDVRRQGQQHRFVKLRNPQER